MEIRDPDDLIQLMQSMRMAIQTIEAAIRTGALPLPIVDIETDGREEGRPTGQGNGSSG